MSQPAWEKFQLQRREFNSYKSTQNRDILDQEIPFEIAHYACELYSGRFWLYFKAHPYVLSSYKQHTGEPCQEMVCSEAFVRFGPVPLKMHWKKA
ncbi:MAG TPA: hypothetical protein VD905_22270 [Flavobacteriales bacterium]|nr:hypothetical protein [Flavobacteriales bacterium]